MKTLRALEQIQEADLRMLLWCGKSRFYPSFLEWVRLVSKSGDGYMQVAFPIALWAILPSLGTQFILLFIYAFTIERIIYFILKNTLKRRRPPEVIANFTSIVQASDQFSFPSGHTMAAFLLAGLSVLVIGAEAAILYLWAIAVGISRVVLGVHFPTDILAGATLGSAIAYYAFYYL